MTTDLRIKNICPVIGMISSGKSSILNALFNMDYLEATPQITTKIVTIIRYNSTVTNPRFYKINVKNEGNDNFTFLKVNDSEVVGKENIRDRIKNLNKELQKQEVPKYEDIFYLLEVGQVNFIETEFLKNNDLADVPGVSENIKNKENQEKTNSTEDECTLTSEEKIKNMNLEKEINYLTQIFKILKNRMNNGIFILSVDKLQLAENYEIIAKLQKILDKPIENFLILLNKMDTSDNIQRDIEILNEKFVEEFPNGLFNLTRNTIVQCSSFQLENELKMDKDFSHFLYFLYINYIMAPRDCHNFIDFVKQFMKNDSKKDTQEMEKDEFIKCIKSIENDPNLTKIQDLIKKIHERHDTTKMPLLINEEDFKLENIQKSFNSLVVGEDDEGNEIIDIYLQSESNLILYYYYLYKNQKIKFRKSSETETILNYFTIQNMNKKFNYKEVELQLQEIENSNTINKKTDDLIEKINKFEETYKNGGLYLNQIEGFNNSITPIINNFKTSKYFYIPLLGVYNSGKSTILNDLIGYNLLPTKTGECTKKGILLINWDKDFPIIRKAKYIIENDISYFQISNSIIAEGDKNVRKILNGVNGNFIEKEEDFFYVINVKIKFLDNFEDYNIKELKEKICFVDLPGYGTKNKFETKDIYSKFIKSCKLLLMITRDHFGDTNNVAKINSLLEKIKNYQGISTQALVKKILFVINYKNLDTSEKSLHKNKSDLIKNIDALKENAINDIKLTFFNGLNYLYYLINKFLFSSPKNIFKEIKNNYDKDLENFKKGYSNQNPSNKFEIYFFNQLKNRLKSIYGKNIEQIEKVIDKEVGESVDKIISEKKYIFKENVLNDIKAIISYSKENIEQSKYINESNYVSFKDMLKHNILIGKVESHFDLRKLIEKELNNLDQIFTKKEDSNIKPPEYIGINNDYEQKILFFEKEMENIKLKIENEKLSERSVPKIFEKSINEINTVLEDLKNNIEKKLKSKNWKDIQKEFEETFDRIVKDGKKDIISSLINSSDKMKQIYEAAFEKINEFKKNPDSNYKFDELKIYISNQLEERNNYEEAIDNIVNDIISSSKEATFWKNRTGFFDFLKTKFNNKAYLNKTIDFIINKSKEKLDNFKKVISKIIDEYAKEILNKISIESISISNYLQEQKKIKDLEENLKKQQYTEKLKNFEKIKLENEEKNKKWNEICDEYCGIKSLINNLVLETDIQKTKKVNPDQSLILQEIQMLIITNKK